MNYETLCSQYACRLAKNFTKSECIKIANEINELRIGKTNQLLTSKQKQAMIQAILHKINPHAPNREGHILVLDSDNSEYLRLLNMAASIMKSNVNK